MSWSSSVSCHLLIWVTIRKILLRQDLIVPGCCFLRHPGPCWFWHSLSVSLPSTKCHCFVYKQACLNRWGLSCGKNGLLEWRIIMVWNWFVWFFPQGPPANSDAREKAMQGIKPFEDLITTKCKGGFGVLCSSVWTTPRVDDRQVLVDGACRDQVPLG